MTWLSHPIRTLAYFVGIGNFQPVLEDLASITDPTAQPTEFVIVMSERHNYLTSKQDQHTMLVLA